MPFVDTLELAVILGEAYATMHRALSGLLADGIAGRVNHGTVHLPTSARWFLTAEGIGEAADRLGFATPSEFVRAYPVSQQWLTLLLRRMDAVASVYRLAMALSPGHGSRRSRVEFHRRGRFDATITLHNGRTFGVVRQGLGLRRRSLYDRLRAIAQYDISHRPGTVLVLVPSPREQRLTARLCERLRLEDSYVGVESLDELEDGREYYVFVTTGDGLYRYDINDIVRVDGWVANTPTFAFVQKGKGVTNITGEKVTEAQVLDAVTSAFAPTGAPPEFFIMLADEAASGYTLYVETGASAFAGGGAADEIDRLLSVSNIEYESKRKSGRLAPLRVRLLPDGAGGRYRESCVASGQRDAQFKYLHLQYARDCAFDFDAIAVAE
ncbi:MAG: GH3 auxin-responsive promoter family protein [Chloroflexota bacterium]|nr:GH3 auxin-responsive promoter family protein [Chloroflexota bacterium]MDE2885608.1 GH3 auxin-responsive promoter family protein [Chloroflexota bacterium]